MSSLINLHKVCHKFNTEYVEQFRLFWVSGSKVTSKEIAKSALIIRLQNIAAIGFQLWKTPALFKNFITKACKYSLSSTSALTAVKITGVAIGLFFGGILASALAVVSPWLVYSWGGASGHFEAMYKYMDDQFFDLEAIYRRIPQIEDRRREINIQRL